MIKYLSYSSTKTQIYNCLEKSIGAKLTKYRTYGKDSVSIVVLHGGPGALGEMKPIAIFLGKEFGVIEPLQSSNNIKGQIEELNTVIGQNTKHSITVIGFSWGAMLGLLFTANNPHRINKLILIASGPLTHESSLNIMKTRLDRLSSDNRNRILELQSLLSQNETANKNQKFMELGELISLADSFHIDETVQESIEIKYDVFKSLWPEVDKFRKNGGFIEAVSKINCPVRIIHGEYDSHPVDNLIELLVDKERDLKYHILKKCGHKPWREKYASKEFYEILIEFINN